MKTPYHLLILVAFSFALASCNNDKETRSTIHPFAMQIADTECAIDITAAELQALADSDKVVGAIYKITDCSELQNPNGYPVYILCAPCPLYFGHLQGYMHIPNAFELNPVTLSPTFNFITRFRDELRDITAIQHDGNTGSLSITRNCVKFAIHATAMCWAGGIPQWENNYFEDCFIDYPDDIADLQFVGITVHANATLVLGGGSETDSRGLIATLYYADIAKHAYVKIGLNSIVLYLNAGMHDSIVIGEGCYAGKDQGLGVGQYYTDAPHHHIRYILEDSVKMDSNYVFLMTAADVRIGKHSNYNKKNLIVGAQSQHKVGDSALIEGNISIQNCAYLNQKGKNFHLTGNISVEDFVYINDSIDNVTWPGGTIRRDGSTIPLSINIGTDSSPDMKMVKWGGHNTVSFTGDTITVTSFDNLRNNCNYAFYVPTGKTMVFDDGVYFQTVGNTNFTLNSDGIVYLRTNANNSKAYLQTYNY